MRLSGLSASLTLALLAATAHAEVVGVALHLPDRLPADRASLLARAAELAFSSSETRRYIGPRAALDRIVDAPRLAAQRVRARQMLARARSLMRELRYLEADRLLIKSEAGAAAGLARLAEPRLLAAILFERGLVQQAINGPESDQLLVLSFSLWPRALDLERYAPKVRRALQRAARRAGQVPPPELDERQASQAAAVLGADRLLIITPSAEPGRESAALAVFDARRGRRSSSRAIAWPRGATRDQVAARLAAASRLGPPPPSLAMPPDATPPDAPPPAPAPSRTAAWLTTGTALALAVVGGTLLGVSRARAGEVESLATSPPSVEYDPRARDLERSAQTLNTAGVVALSAAGAAAVVSTILWLTSSRRHPSPEHSRARLEVNPGLLSVSFR
jgi:hypothetical protein